MRLTNDEVRVVAGGRCNCICEHTARVIMHPEGYKLVNSSEASMQPGKLQPQDYVYHFELGRRSLGIFASRVDCQKVCTTSQWQYFGCFLS